MIGINPVGREAVHAHLHLHTFTLGKRALAVVPEKILETHMAAQIILIITTETKIRIGVQHETIGEIHLNLGERKPLHPIVKAYHIAETHIFVAHPAATLNR